jgi:dihydroorotate dehydrogenase (fumarate)
VDLRTRYLGLDLANPLMPGASPLAEDADMARRLEDAGASAIVMHSLFEEEIAQHAPTADSYLGLLHRLKQRVGVPVIASLNGTAARWLRYAGLLQRGGRRCDNRRAVLSAPQHGPRRPASCV